MHMYIAGRQGICARHTTQKQSWPDFRDSSGARTAQDRTEIHAVLQCNAFHSLFLHVGGPFFCFFVPPSPADTAAAAVAESHSPK